MLTKNSIEMPATHIQWQLQLLNLFGALNVELADVNHTLYSGYRR